MTSRAAIDAYLAVCASLPTDTRVPDPDECVSTVPREDRVALAVALIAEHRAGRLSGLAYFGAERAFGQLLATSQPLTESEICMLARAVGATGSCLCGYPWRFAWAQAERHIDAHDVSADLDDALRALQASMKVHGSDKNAALEIDRRLFFQTHSALDPTTSWGDEVRGSLRKMSGQDAKAWRELLQVAMAVDRAEPKPTNEAKLDRAAKKVPHVTEHVAGWLQDLAAHPTRSLAPADADVVRALLWIGTPRECPSPDVLLALGDVTPGLAGRATASSVAFDARAEAGDESFILVVRLHVLPQGTTVTRTVAQIVGRRLSRAPQGRREEKSACNPRSTRPS